MTHHIFPRNHIPFVLLQGANIARSFSRNLTLLLIATSITGTATARADMLFITDGYQLGRLNTDTLTVTTIGGIGFRLVGGLAFGNDGTLYGLSTQVEPQLIRIDTDTGAGTAIGRFVNTSFSTSLANDPIPTSL